MSLAPGMILKPALSSDLLPVPHRILHIDIKSETVWCIELPRFLENGRAAGYVRGPIPLGLGEIISALEAGHLTQARFDAPGHWAMSDADYLADHFTRTELKHRKWRVQQRDKAWKIVRPIVSNHSLPDLLGWEAMRPLVLERASEYGCSAVTVYRLLHVYWAHGSVVNGLMPATHRCGAPGTERHPRKSIGRPSTLCRIEGASRALMLTDLDKRRIGIAYALRHTGMVLSDAYAQMNSVFYADVVVNADGHSDVRLFLPHLRPTLRQFRYWGKKLSSSAEFRKRNGLPYINAKRSHKGGSTRTLSEAVGESAQFDSTSTDVYLTSMFDRRKKLSPPTRSVLIEQRSTAILAPYVAWSYPSSSTFLETLYLGATNKVEFCARFGIHIAPDEWPGLLCRTLFGDNGEMRSERVMDVAAQLGFGVEYAPSYAGAAKGDIESLHHAVHKRFDHRLPGTTKGRRRERGEKHPANFALWNFYEYVRELLLVCIAYNNTEVPELAPTQLIAAGTRPTRINILKWLLKQGQRADVPFDMHQLRAWTLPSWDAVIQYNGLILKYPDSEDRIHELRFFCEALREDDRYDRAARTRKVMKVAVRFQPENLAEVWLPSQDGFLRVPNVQSDQALLRNGTIADLRSHKESEAIWRARQQQSADQEEAQTLRKRAAVTEGAEADIEHLGDASRASKARQPHAMRKNAVAEQQAISSTLSGQSPLGAEPPDPGIALPASKPDEAAAASVAAFVETLAPEK